MAADEAREREAMDWSEGLVIQLKRSRTLHGEVWWVNFDRSLGGEIQKTTPAIIVSNDFSTHNLNRVQVAPLTSNVARIYPLGPPSN